MVRAADLETMTAQTAAEIKSGKAPTGSYYGFIDIDYLEAPPFVMFHAGDCGVCDKILTYGTFEPASLAVWCRLAGTASGILDIGGYTGIYAMAAAGLRPDLMVHAFEPNPFSMARLRTNRYTNKLLNIQEHLYGVGADNKLARLYWNKKHLPFLNSAATFAEYKLMDPKRFESALAEIRRIDEPDFCASVGTRGLIKIDVEGAEVLVMHGLSRLLPQRPDMILETFSAQACDAINGLLAPLGYRAYFIDEQQHRLERRERLMPADPGGAGMNQFLTTRDVLPLPVI